MARSIPSRPLTPADQLRQLLDRSEERAVGIAGAGASAAQELLHWLDEVHEQFPTLEAEGMNLAPERGRWQAVQGAVRRHDASLRRELAPLGGLSSLRQAQTPLPAKERWWWWLDELARQRLRKRLLMGALAALAVVALVIGGGRLFSILFPVDPAVAAAYEARAAGERAVNAGDLESAIAHFEKARAAKADDIDALGWLSVLYELRGEEEKAAEANDALTALTDPALAYAMRSSIFTGMGEPEQGLILAEAAVAADASSPQAYLTLGSALEALGRYAEAVNAYGQASDVAEAANQSDLQAIARVRMAQLLQNAPVGD